MRRSQNRTHGAKGKICHVECALHLPMPPPRDTLLRQVAGSVGDGPASRKWDGQTKRDSMPDSSRSLPPAIARVLELKNRVEPLLANRMPKIPTRSRLERLRPAEAQTCRPRELRRVGGACKHGKRPKRKRVAGPTVPAHSSAVQPPPQLPEPLPAPPSRHARPPVGAKQFRNSRELFSGWGVGWGATYAAMRASDTTNDGWCGPGRNPRVFVRSPAAPVDIRKPCAENGTPEAAPDQGSSGNRAPVVFVAMGSNTSRCVPDLIVGRSSDHRPGSAEVCYPTIESPQPPQPPESTTCEEPSGSPQRFGADDGQQGMPERRLQRAVLLLAYLGAARRVRLQERWRKHALKHRTKPAECKFVDDIADASGDAAETIGSAAMSLILMEKEQQQGADDENDDEEPEDNEDRIFHATPAPTPPSLGVAEHAVACVLQRVLCELQPTGTPLVSRDSALYDVAADVVSSVMERVVGEGVAGELAAPLIQFRLSSLEVLEGVSERERSCSMDGVVTDIVSSMVERVVCGCDAVQPTTPPNKPKHYMRSARQLQRIRGAKTGSIVEVLPPDEGDEESMNPIAAATLCDGAAAHCK